MLGEQQAPNSQPRSSVPAVHSLERGLSVIRAFDMDHPEMTLSEVARRAGLTRAAARRFLHTLVAMEYVATDGRQFWLRPRILELGYSYLSSLNLPELSAFHLKDLADRLHESTSLCVLDLPDVVYVARVPVRRMMAVSIAVGTRLPAFTTSTGRVLLAGLSSDQLASALEKIDCRPDIGFPKVGREEVVAVLDGVREAGHALIDHEFERGVRSIAAPVRNPAGAVVAAVNVSAASSSVSVDELKERLLPELLVTRDAIERDVKARYPGGFVV